MTESQGPQARPLLFRGELLRQSADRPRSGGGAKYYPFTVEESVERLKPQVATLTSDIAAMRDEYRGQSLILEATLMPNFLANSYYPAQLLEYVRVSLVGTAYGVAPRRSQTDPNPDVRVPTKRLFLEASSESIQLLDSLLDEPNSRIVPAAVRENLRVLEDVRLPKVVPQVPVESELEYDDGLQLWEGVLHPTVPPEAGGPWVSSTFSLQRLSSLVESNGGRVASDWVRNVEGTIFVPLLLPNAEAAADIANFNPLRALHPNAQTTRSRGFPRASRAAGIADPSASSLCGPWPAPSCSRIRWRMR